MDLGDLGGSISWAEPKTLSKAGGWPEFSVKWGKNAGKHVDLLGSWGDHGNWKMMVKNGVVIGRVSWKMVVLRDENRVKHGGFTMKK